MTKHHGKKGDHKQVRKNIEIALEKAEKMSQGTLPPELEDTAKTTIPEDELTSLREKAEKADDYYEDFLRSAAELENYKKRVERDRQALIKYGQEELISDLLLVLDNFDRAVEAAESSTGNDSVLEGVRLIRKQLVDTLKKNGLEPIDAFGKPFNPELHEAISQVETADYPDGTVISVQMRGYCLNGRLLRPSAVTVSQIPDE